MRPLIWLVVAHEVVRGELVDAHDDLRPGSWIVRTRLTDRVRRGSRVLTVAECQGMEAGGRVRISTGRAEEEEARIAAVSCPELHLSKRIRNKALHVSPIQADGLIANSPTAETSPGMVTLSVATMYEHAPGGSVQASTRLPGAGQIRPIALTSSTNNVPSQCDNTTCVHGALQNEKTHIAGHLCCE